MTKSWQIYYNTVFGALGGLITWLVIGLIPTGTWPVTVANAFVGGGIGAILGVTLGMVDGAIFKRSAQRALMGAVSSGAVGIIGGAIGLLIGGLVFILLEGGLIPRMLGWMLLGLALGLGQSILSRKIKRISYSLIGGTVAGLVGGALYEVFTMAFLDQSGEAQVYLSALGLVLIGACLGSIIPLTLEMAREGMVVILNGTRANMEVSVIGQTMLGSSDACEVYVPDDSVAEKQAVINKTGSGFVIQNIGSRTFMVNQAAAQPGQSLTLSDGALIQMGDIQMRFTQR